ncbi:MAG: MlaE family lipid ABC transporter permease subunit [Paracoccaceae bacterium]
MTAPTLTVDTVADTLTIRIAGSLLTGALDRVERPAAQVPMQDGQVVFDLSGMEAFDTGGAWLIADLRNRLQAAGADVTLQGLDPDYAALLDNVASHFHDEDTAEAPPHGFVPWVATVGARTVGAWQGFLSVLSFFGLTLHRTARVIVMPWRLRSASLFTQMEETGLKAIPIVALMGFLIGVVLAFQGATQLQQFGAEVFVVELISISILRELGILLTAIIVAGRSGSAFTAAIGSMKVQEELDAMRTLGLDPMDVLVVPRTMALLIMLPILGFIADVAGLFGGALMSWINLGVSPGMFVTRLQETTSVWHLAVGLIKAPFFALVIAVLSCWQAMQVRGSAQSVGERTTASVVQSIFAVIALDAIFSILFSELGV